MKNNKNLIPIDLLFKKSDKTGVKLSPDGKFISYLKSFEGKSNIFIQNLETKEIKRLTKSDKNIFDYYWINNSILYFLDKDGSGNHEIFLVDINQNLKSFLIPGNSRLLKILNNENILIENNQKNRENYDIYKINIKKAQTELISENRGDMYYNIIDYNGKHRVAFTKRWI